jgi:hypothetical protein
VANIKYPPFDCVWEIYERRSLPEATQLTDFPDFNFPSYFDFNLNLNPGDCGQRSPLQIFVASTMTDTMNDTILASQGSPLSEAVKALASPHKLLTYMLCLLLAWPVVASALRNQRVRNLKKQYPYPTRASMSKMTDEHAFQIQKQVAQLEFPFMFIKSLQFALFRV